ncbi:hypothetical protein Q8A73_015462 [Channa argus]|nr:hypothetical protein Q8A73_015462 [Channa argus]
MHKGATKTLGCCEETPAFRGQNKELCDLQRLKREGVVGEQDNGRLPGPHWWRPDAQGSKRWFPFRFPSGTPLQSMNGRAHIPTSPPPRRTSQIVGLQSSRTHRSLDPLLHPPVASLKTTLLPRAQNPCRELRGRSGNNNGADEGPKLPCGFTEKGDHRVLSTIV